MQDQKVITELLIDGQPVNKEDFGFLMYPVISSNIKSLGSRQGNIMLVEFTNGTFYKYTPVSWELFESVRTASSVGKRFNESVKANPDIKFEQVTPKRVQQIIYI